MNKIDRVVRMFMCVTFTALSATCSVLVVLGWSEAPWREIVPVALGVVVAAWSARIWAEGDPWGADDD